MNLSCIECGKTVVIKSISAESRFKKRLQTLGVISGAKIKVIRKTPLSGAAVIECGGYLYAMRKEAAEFIEVDYE